MKKIKRIRSDVFLSLKELVKNVKVISYVSIKRKRRKRAFKRKQRPPLVVKNRAHEYEPSTATRLFNSHTWQWQRAREWDRYINNKE